MVRTIKYFIQMRGHHYYYYHFVYIHIYLFHVVDLRASAVLVLKEAHCKNIKIQSKTTLPCKSQEPETVQWAMAGD